jgi:hypothetical protein
MMIRLRIAGLALVLLSGCGRDPGDLSGDWDGTSSEWGKVALRGLEGTYTDTYGPPPGKLTLERTGPRAFKGTWQENEKHGGTLAFTVSEDGLTASGTYKVWDTSPRRPGYEGKVHWTRK